MKLHANARTCPKSRQLQVGRVEAVAESAAPRPRALVGALARGGPSVSSTAPRAAPDPATRRRLTGSRGRRRLRRLADDGGADRDRPAMALSTVSAVLKRASGWASARGSIRPSPDERRRPGELVHIPEPVA